MQNVAGHSRSVAYQSVLSAIAVSLCCVGLACREAALNPDTEKKTGMQKPVTSFRQILISSTTNLQLHPGEDSKIPVQIQNPGAETWTSTGQYPVTVSYKWYKGGQMMSIEGERTILPTPVGPHDAINADVRVVAPPEPGKYTLRLSLVQEAVAWFMLKSNTFLEIPVTVQ
jgi:hypothetical protein